MVIVEPEERVVRHYRRTSWLSSVPLLAFSLFVLFFEVLKSTRTGGNSVVDHALSMMVFVACLILFLVWPLAGTSLFFLIMLTTLVDVIAGFSVTIRSARRDYSVGGEN